MNAVGCADGPVKVGLLIVIIITISGALCADCVWNPAHPIRYSKGPLITTRAPHVCNNMMMMIRVAKSI